MSNASLSETYEINWSSRENKQLKRNHVSIHQVYKYLATSGKFVKQTI